MLKKGVEFKWYDKSQVAFDSLKHYLMNAPILTPLDESKPLLLYVSTTMQALGAMLAQHDDQGREREIYYINKTLHEI